MIKPLHCSLQVKKDRVFFDFHLFPSRKFLELFSCNFEHSLKKERMKIIKIMRHRQRREKGKGKRERGRGGEERKSGGWDGRDLCASLTRILR